MSAKILTQYNFMINIEKPKAYIVKMSQKGMDIQIDSDEVQQVVSGIVSGQPIKVRKGIINPSFYVGIVEDVERISNYISRLNDVIANNDSNERFGIGEKKQLPQFEKLNDIFSGLELTAGNKRLKN